MKPKYFVLLIALCFVALSAAPAFAVTLKIRAEIPFDFNVGKKRLPKGEYTIESINDWTLNLMLNQRWFRYLSAYFFWALSLALAAWLLILTRNTVPSWVASAILDNPAHASQLAAIFDKVLILLGCIGWLVLLIVIEQYFRKGVTRGNLWGRIERVIGILLILIFLVDSAQMIRNKFTFTFWASWLILIVELGLGAGLIYLSRNLRSGPSKGSRSF